MNDLLTRSILLSSHSAIDRSQQGLGISPIEVTRFFLHRV